MNYYEERSQKTDAELFAEYPSIEPEYTRASAIAEKVMTQFQAEQFQPLLKKVSDHITEHLWDIFKEHIVSDAEMNVGGHIRDRVESTIHALLSGQEWAINRYVTGTTWRSEEIRAGIAKLIPEELQAQRVKDLEKEVARLKEDLEWARRRF